MSTAKERRFLSILIRRNESSPLSHLNHNYVTATLMLQLYNVATLLLKFLT